MKIFKNKFLTKLIAAICLFLTLLNFTGTSKVYAKDDDQVWGGVLIKPITNLLTGIGDAIMDTLHYHVQSQQTSLIKINGDQDWWAVLKNAFIVIAIIVCAVAFVAVAAATAGLANAALAVLAGETFSFSMGTVTAGTIMGSLVVGCWVGIRAGNAFFPDDIYLPVYTLSAEEIFSNNIALFDVNFFNPNKYEKIEVVEKPDDSTGVDGAGTDTDFGSVYGVVDMWKTLVSGENFKYKDVRSEAESLEEQTITVGEAKGKAFKDIIEEVDAQLEEDKKITDDMQFTIYKKQYNYEEDITSTTYVFFQEKPATSNITTTNKYIFGIRRTADEKDYLYIIHKKIETAQQSYSYNEYGVPETSLQPTGVSETLSYELINLESGSDDHSTPLDKYETIKVEIQSIAAQLKGTISTWYYILRNTALLVLMLLLMYSGIRIVIGSTAGEKAKYKERLTDWLVAICLVMIMHYIMVFAINMVEEITGLVGNLTNKGLNSMYIPLTSNQWDNAQKLDWTEFRGQ